LGARVIASWVVIVVLFLFLDPSCEGDMQHDLSGSILVDRVSFMSCKAAGTSFLVPGTRVIIRDGEGNDLASTPVGPTVPRDGGCASPFKVVVPESSAYQLVLRAGTESPDVEIRSPIYSLEGLEAHDFVLDVGQEQLSPYPIAQTPSSTPT
jgi:hypothetical protein